MKAIFAVVLAVALASSSASASPLAAGAAADGAAALGVGALGAAGLAGLGDIIAKVGAANKAAIAAVATGLGVDAAIAETIVVAIGLHAVPALLAVVGAGVPLVAAIALFHHGLFPFAFGLHHLGFPVHHGVANFEARPFFPFDILKIGSPALGLPVAGAAAAIPTLLTVGAAAAIPKLLTDSVAAATRAALALFAAPKLHATLPLAQPGLLAAATATAPAVLTEAALPLLLASPWLNAVFALLAPVLFAGPATIAPAAIAAFSAAPFVKTAVTAPFPFGFGLPATDPAAAALLTIISLTYNVGFFAPAILFAALPLVIPVLQAELWAGPIVAFVTSTLFPVAAETAAAAASGLHGATVVANKLVQ